MINKLLLLACFAGLTIAEAVVVTSFPDESAWRLMVLVTSVGAVFVVSRAVSNA